MFDLSGKVAIVTGGGSGIGEAICHALARHGAHVCILDVNIEQAQRVQADIVAGEGRATVCLHDEQRRGDDDDVFRGNGLSQR